MGKFIVKYRYIFLAVFVGLLILCGAFIPTMINRVNYDLTSYLPSGYDTNDGYDFLSQNFNIHGDVEAGVLGTREQIAEAATQIADVEGVTGAIWANMVEMLLEFGVYQPDPETGEFDEDFKTIYGVLTDAPVPKMINGEIVYDEAEGTAYNWAILVTLEYPPSTPQAIEAYGKIVEILKNVVGENNYSTSGMTEQANALYETVFDEIWIYLIVAGIVVIAILLVTTNSLMEPLILILTLVISIVINLGSNAGAILQLGLSMDYAIFLMHQYRAELKTNLDPKQALAAAIPKSVVALASSALTTIVGLLALIAMKFEIGFDLGLSLAKGIVCSLITVLFLQPCLMLILDKARVKTQHKCLDFHFRAPVKRSIRDRRWVYNYVKFMPESTDTSYKHQMAQTLGNQLMIVVPNDFTDSNGVKHYLVEENYKFLEKLKALGAEQVTVEYKGEDVTVDKISFMLGMYVMFPEDSTVNFSGMELNLSQLLRLLDAYKDSGFDFNADDWSGNAALYRLVAAIGDIIQDPDGDGVRDESIPRPSIGDLTGMMGDGNDMQGYLDTFQSYVNGGYTMYTVGITYPEIDNESQTSFDILDQIKEVANEVFGEGGLVATKYADYTPMRCYFTGYTQGAYDFAAVTPTDFALVTGISVAAILIILIFTLRGLKRPILLVALIEFGIFLNLVMQYIFAGGEINFMSYLIISAVQLGATVDYAILVTTKYRNLRKTWEPRQAAYRATTSSVMSVLTSALIMAGACFSICFSTSNLIIEEITFLVARGALISALLVIFVLPALLAVTDKPNGNELHIMRTPKLRPLRFGKKFKYAPQLAEELPEGGGDSTDNGSEEFTAMLDEGTDGASPEREDNGSPQDGDNS